MNRVLAFCLCFSRWNAGLAGGKLTVITSSMLRLLVTLIFGFARASSLYVFVSIAQLTRSRLGPMECMESSGKRYEQQGGAQRR